MVGTYSCRLMTDPVCRKFPLSYGAVPARDVLKRKLRIVSTRVLNLYDLIDTYCIHTCIEFVRTVYLDCEDKASRRELIGVTRTLCNPTLWQLLEV